MSEYWELKEKGLVKVLTLNSVRCLVCNEVLVSKSQHHFVMCSCPNETATDGGNSYQRFMGRDLDKVEDLSKYIVMTEQEYEDMLERKRIKDEEILQQNFVLKTISVVKPCGVVFVIAEKLSCVTHHTCGGVK